MTPSQPTFVPSALASAASARYNALVPDQDSALIAAARAGDRHALEALLERHAPSVFRFAMRMCRDRHDADDVLQETLLAAVKGLDTYRGEGALGTWLYAVARSFCIKKHRRGKHAPVAVESLDAEAMASATPSPDDAMAHGELARALDRAISGLDDKYREVLLLRDVHGLSAAETAEAVGIGVDAVKSRLHRARAQVRQSLLPYMEAPVPSTPVAEGCRDVVTMFSQYLEGDIDAAACATMQKHVQSCASCTAACDSLRQAVGLCQAAGSEELPADVQAKVRTALEAAVREAHA